jgi:tRNA pseudouridine38-40 synthase
VQTIAASRTDSGVHAEEQVVLFRTEQPFAEERWIRSLNGLLPESMGILNISPVPEGFHPIYSAKGKVYRYRIWKGSSRHPQWAPLSWNVHRPLDVGVMVQAAKSFIGSHDFTSFCAVDSSAKTRTRLIYGIQIVEAGPLVEIWVFGKGFLKQMVRIMVGTMVEIGVGRRPASSLPDILRGQNRALAGKTAPAQGLSLVRVFYGELPSPEDFRQHL